MTKETKSELEKSQQIEEVVISFFMEGITSDVFPNSIIAIKDVIKSIVKRSLLCTQTDFLASHTESGRDNLVQESLEKIKNELISHFTKTPLKKNFAGFRLTDNKLTQRLVGILRDKEDNFGFPSRVFDQIGQVVGAEATSVSSSTLVSINASKRDLETESKKDEDNVMVIPPERFHIALMLCIQSFPNEVEGFFTRMSEMGRIGVSSEPKVVIDPNEIWQLYKVFKTEHHLDANTNSFAVWDFILCHLVKTNSERIGHRERIEVVLEERSKIIGEILMVLILNNVSVEPVSTSK